MRGMLVIATIGLKGGTSKTTSAVWLAHAFRELDWVPLLVDADPQQSAAAWSRLAPDPFPFDTVRLDSPTLDQLLPDYTRHRANVVVIDCPPREQHTAIVRAAMRAASLALYPIAPTPVEYARLAATRAVVGGLPMAVLLTRTVPNAASTTAYRDAMTEAGLWVLKTQVGRREVYAQSFGDNIQAAAGGPYGDAAAELIREGRHRW